MSTSAGGLVRIPKGLDSALGSALSILSGTEGTIRIVTHYDADGLCAAGVLCRALLRSGRPFHVRITRKFGPALFSSLAAEKYNLTIFLDSGSEQIDKVEGLSGNAVVLDHHQPGRGSKHVLDVNPHHHGIDGAAELSASTLTYLLTRRMDHCNINLFPYALAGAIGDKQDLGGLKGLNRELAAEAEKAGVIEGVRIPRFADGVLSEALAESISPYIPGLTGRPEAVGSFLSDLMIVGEGSFISLTPEKRRILLSFLSLRLLERGTAPENIAELNPLRYRAPALDLYIDHLSGMVNACGRLGDEGTGLAVCLGDPSALEKAKELRARYRDKVREGLRKLEDGAVTKGRGMQFFWGEEPTITGAVCGLGIQYVVDSSLPVMGLTPEGEEVSVSARGTRALVSKGLNLASVCKEAAEVAGGSGGGHDVAAGANVPRDRIEEFLTNADEIAAKQLGRA
ncbi:MAG: DHH family phosphoesterase [Candidatus Thermoplasmatota archaeon]